MFLIQEKGKCMQIIQKIFYNKETIAELNYEIHKMSFIPPFYATKMFNLFLTLRISDNREKIGGHSDNEKVKSL